MKSPKRNQKSNQKGCVSQEQHPNLTPAQAEILTYLQYEGLTVSQIAARRGCSKQYIRKVRKQLRDYGILSKVAPPLFESGGLRNPRNQRPKIARSKI